MADGRRGAISHQRARDYSAGTSRHSLGASRHLSRVAVEKEARRVARREAEAEQWAQARIRHRTKQPRPTNRAAVDYLALNYPGLADWLSEEEDPADRPPEYTIKECKRNKGRNRKNTNREIALDSQASEPSTTELVSAEEASKKEDIANSNQGHDEGYNDPYDVFPVTDEFYCEEAEDFCCSICFNACDTRGPHIACIPPCCEAVVGYSCYKTTIQLYRKCCICELEVSAETWTVVSIKDEDTGETPRLLQVKPNQSTESIPPVDLTVTTATPTKTVHASYAAAFTSSEEGKGAIPAIKPGPKYNFEKPPPVTPTFQITPASPQKDSPKIAIPELQRSCSHSSNASISTSSITFPKPIPTTHQPPSLDAAISPKSQPPNPNLSDLSPERPRSPSLLTPQQLAALPADFSGLPRHRRFNVLVSVADMRVERERRRSSRSREIVLTEEETEKYERHAEAVKQSIEHLELLIKKSQQMRKLEDDLQIKEKEYLAMLLNIGIMQQKWSQIKAWRKLHHYTDPSGTIYRVVPPPGFEGPQRLSLFMTGIWASRMILPEDQPHVLNVPGTVVAPMVYMFTGIHETIPITLRPTAKDFVPASARKQQDKKPVQYFQSIHSHYRLIQLRPAAPVHHASNTVNNAIMAKPLELITNLARSVFALEVTRRTINLSSTQLSSFLAIPVPAVDSTIKSVSLATEAVKCYQDRGFRAGLKNLMLAEGGHDLRKLAEEAKINLGAGVRAELERAASSALSAPSDEMVEEEKEEEEEVVVEGEEADGAQDDTPRPSTVILVAGQSPVSLGAGPSSPSAPPQEQQVQYQWTWIDGVASGDYHHPHSSTYPSRSSLNDRDG